MKAISRSMIIAAAILIVIVILGVYFTLRPGVPAQTPATPTTPQTPIETTPTPIVSKKDTLRVAIGIDLDTVDPHGQTTTVVFNVVRHVYETLVWYDDKGDVIPWLAERWEVSPDGLVYTFYLRKGVKFHDGSEFDAYTVKANVDRWVDPTVRVPLRGQLPIVKAEVVDKYTVKIYFKEPYAPALRAIASYLLIAGSKVIEKYGNKTITEAIGTGPYKFISWEKGKRVVLEVNEEYWGGKPYVKRIEWLIIPDATTRVAALLAKDVDFAYNLPPTDIDRVKAAGLQLVMPASNRIIFIAMLPKGPLADPKVRQALNHAVDKKAIIDHVLYGLGIDSRAPLPSHFFGYAEMPPYEYDIDKAKRLLAEAGYPQGFKITLLHPTGRYLQDKQVAEAVQAYLSRIGVQVELRTMDWPSFVAEIARKPLEEKTYDMVLLGWGPFVADAHFTLHGQFHSKQAPPRGLAAAHYSNPEVDVLLEQAVREVDVAKRRELYRKAIEIIWRDAPWIFLYVQKWFYGAAADLKGFTVFVDGEQIFFHKAYFG